MAENVPSSSTETSARGGKNGLGKEWILIDGDGEFETHDAFSSSPLDSRTMLCPLAMKPLRFISDPVERLKGGEKDINVVQSSALLQRLAVVERRSLASSSSTALLERAFKLLFRLRQLPKRLRDAAEPATPSASKLHAFVGTDHLHDAETRSTRGGVAPSSPSLLVALPPLHHTPLF